MSESAEKTFEQAMQELEQLVHELEQADLPLEQALSKFEHAVNLSKISQQRLQQAEQKVALLLQQQQGESLTDFADDSDGAIQ
ncbi:exodeoxyribonuclease VII small subunit [Idiomarina xiamenensis]|uniref:Exodeoxyribonuclease 7 small subunit n=1 Tax=Idiomarina xiamenensis 10-D-4 TaxID=740709 RepID=K2JW23_9GAMM|nr:exodeoxyribonuclease VII small subunit [Idiomarina xiamenensis]EKE87596.1 exodeoxyribonuclease VII small subunit [Idiomarina xiamenensis 10-D-4]